MFYLYLSLSGNTETNGYENAEASCCGCLGGYFSVRGMCRGLILLLFQLPFQIFYSFHDGLSLANCVGFAVI